MRVSVIVPAFNAAPYVERCLESLAAQDPPVEIILVNDGSTDGTLDIVRQWRATRSRQLLCIDQPNRGLSAARNAGLAVASGEFVGFVDSDDWVAPDMYAVLLSAALRGDAEIVICGGDMVDHQTGETIPFQDATRFSGLAARYTMAVDPRAVEGVFALDTSACKRLYSRALFARARFDFPEGLLFEDVLAHYHLLLHATKVALVDRKLYRYRVRHPGRITDRTDASLLTVFEIMRLTQAVLRSSAVSPVVWAEFIWLQNWVLRWLASKIQSDLRGAFLHEVIVTGRRCPRRGIAEFLRRFDSDQLAQWTVALQMLGFKQTLSRLSCDALTARDRQIIARVMQIRPALPWFGTFS